jgi:ferredoxin
MADATPINPPTVSHVRIVPGCIVCGLCEDTCPEVFDVREDTSVVRPAAERHYRTRALRIIQAAKECPVDVIKVGGFNDED